MAVLLNPSYSQADESRARWQKEPNAKPLILVTEDHADTRFLLKTVLEMRGYDTLEAEDGEQAVRMAVSARPDLILMDASLPRLSGLAATRRMRELLTLCDVPIVFLSGYAEPAFRDVAFSAGCNDYITKPIDFDQLEVVVEKYVGKMDSVKTP